MTDFKPEPLDATYLALITFRRRIRAKWQSVTRQTIKAEDMRCFRIGWHDAMEGGVWPGGGTRVYVKITRRMWRYYDLGWGIGAQAS